jgi:glycosyltransferase involved in cell wall biosynthesis
VTAPWILISGDFVSTGGMDAANLGLAQYLARERKLTVVCHRADPRLSDAGATIVQVKRPLGKHLLGMPVLDRAGRRTVQNTPGAIAVANGSNCILDHQVNWLHYIHSAFEPVAGGGLVRQYSNRLKHRYFCKGERRGVRRARWVIANSELTKRHAVELLGVAPERCKVVYYGTDIERFGLSDADERHAARDELGWADRPMIIYVGSLGDRRKGFDILYDAWRIACDHASFDAKLAVVGHGAELATWQHRAADDRISHRIEFMGFRNDVPKILAAADALVHPARYEAYGLGVHEALCRGVPALVTANSGVAERYPVELTALLLPENTDAPSLAERLLHWRQNMISLRSRTAEFSQSLRQRSWDDMAREILDAAEHQHDNGNRSWVS